MRGETFREGGLPVYHPSKLLEFRMAPDLTEGALYSLHAISCGQRPLGRPGGHKGLGFDVLEGHKWQSCEVVIFEMKYVFLKIGGKPPKWDGLIYENPY